MAQNNSNCLSAYDSGVDDLGRSLLGSLACIELVASCTCLVVGASCRLDGLGEPQLGQLISTLCGFSNFRGLDPAPSPGSLGVVPGGKQKLQGLLKPRLGSHSASLLPYAMGQSKSKTNLDSRD